MILIIHNYKINYKPNNGNEKLRIFGEKFVEHNKDKCKIIYKNKEYDLSEFINDIDKKYNYNDITDMSFMFYECNELFSLSNISKWNTSNVDKMNSMFSGCSKLSSLPDISKWNTSNVNNMSYMFAGCKSDLKIPSNFENRNIY